MWRCRALFECARDVRGGGGLVGVEELDLGGNALGPDGLQWLLEVGGRPRISQAALVMALVLIVPVLLVVVVDRWCSGARCPAW